MVTEQLIRQTLRRLSRQQVGMVLQPGNAWVIEYGVSETEGEDIIASLRTCEMRGWIAVEHQAVPHADLGPDGQLPPGWSHRAPMYRLTEAGWNAIHGYYAWVIAACVFGAASLIVSLVSLALILAGR